MTEYYFSADNKLKTAKLFVQNLMWGLVEIDYEKFESVDEGKKLSAELYHKITWWDNEVLCGDDDPNFVNKTVDWIYDFIIRGRSFGAIRGQLHDKTYEKRIEELESELTKRDKEISELKSENTQLVEKLYEVTAKPPISKEFKAMG